MIEIPWTFEQYFGFCEDDGFRKVLRRAGLSATKNSIFLLLGETGSGKNIFAKALYEFANRRYEDIFDFTLSSLAIELKDGIKGRKKLETCFKNAYSDVKRYFNDFSQKQIKS